MSHPSPELQQEVEVFEKLELRAALSLGRLTQLRRQSREEKRNLLFTAYDAGLVSTELAQQLALELSIDEARALGGSSQSGVVAM